MMIKLLKDMLMKGVMSSQPKSGNLNAAILHFRAGVQSDSE